MKTSRIIIFSLIVLSIISIIAIILYKKYKNNGNNGNSNNNGNKNYYDEFYKFVKDNDLYTDDKCIECLYNKLSQKYNYSDFKNFQYMTEHNDDPTVDLSNNNFANDFYNFGNDCNCK